MKQHPALLLSVSACLLAASALAQPSIGGGSCSSATVSGTYAVSLSGRGVKPAGTLSNVFEAVGTVTFDGQSKATFALTANTALSSGASLPWSGTYALQANCSGTIAVTSSGTASLNLLVYGGGASMQLTGGDSTYAYQGSADTIATGCSTSTVAGVYALSASGYLGVTTGTAGGASTVSGVAQFDGAGNVTVTGTISANNLSPGITTTGPANYNGTYSMGANCVGTATFVNPSLGSGTVTFSAYAGTNALTTTLYIASASSKPDVMFIGNLMWIGPVSAANASMETPLLSPPARENPPELAAMPVSSLEGAL